MEASSCLQPPPLQRSEHSGRCPLITTPASVRNALYLCEALSGGALTFKTVASLTGEV